MRLYNEISKETPKLLVVIFLSYIYIEQYSKLSIVFSVKQSLYFMTVLKNANYGKRTFYGSTTYLLSLKIYSVFV